MLQRIWRQANSARLFDSVYIAACKLQTDIIQSQLDENVPLPLIVEPEQRDTYPAIALASSYLYSVEKAGLDEVIVMMPVDAYVEDRFFETVAKLETVLLESGADLSLVGAMPTYPSEKYGYILPRNTDQGHQYRMVQQFVEKPDEQLARKLIDRGALWNCGVFAFRLGFMIRLLSSKNLPVAYEELCSIYGSLKKISFDYEVVQHVSGVSVLPYKGEWKDLGTWNTLTEEMSTRIIGMGSISEDSRNTHIINELDIPVVVLGISDAVVAASPDGILVTDKSASPRLKQAVGHLTKRPMYEERRWGTYRVLDYTRDENGNEVLTKRIRILAGKNLSYQMHFKRKETWVIVSGEGEFVRDGRWRKVGPGDVLQIPRGARHAIKAIDDLEIIEVQMGSELIEEDIHRLYYNWEEIVQHAAKTL
jgi:mannose-1-phosphate guanylyltransferase